jgi:hypothetical protein
MGVKGEILYSFRMKEDRTMRKEVDVMEKRLSSVKG